MSLAQGLSRLSGRRLTSRLTRTDGAGCSSLRVIGLRASVPCGLLTRGLPQLRAGGPLHPAAACFPCSEQAREQEGGCRRKPVFFYFKFDLIMDSIRDVFHYLPSCPLQACPTLGLWKAVFCVLITEVTPHHPQHIVY